MLNNARKLKGRKKHTGMVILQDINSLSCMQDSGIHFQSRKVQAKAPPHVIVYR